MIQFRKYSAGLLIAGALLTSALSAQAQVIIAPISGVVDASGPGSGSLIDTINQSGLQSNYVNGVTNFDAYLATNPQHTLIFSGYEWFGNYGTSTAVVTYDFGANVKIDKLALWNEESSGIGKFSLLSSTDGINFSVFASNLVPTDNPYANYGAEVFSFNALTTRYVRFDISDSPQIDPGTYPSAAIGEVAFRTAGGDRVPDAASTLSLAGLVLVLAVAARRRLANCC